MKTRFDIEYPDKFYPHLNDNIFLYSNEINKQIIQTSFLKCNINSIDDLLNLIEKYKIDPNIEYNINIKSLHNIKEYLIELNNMIGMYNLKCNIVDQILYFSQNLHINPENKDEGDFLHTVIYGPPGTGKTEIAKIMGKIYSKIGILTNGSFKKVTRSDLIAGYLGQTALKTKDVIKESIGGVLFIDEAYSLGNNEKRDSFSKECIDTLCEALSDNKNNLMVIIAGYENELKECFFDYNQGLDSRFTWRFKTDEYKSEELFKIFLKKIKDIGWNIDENSGINNTWFEKKMDYFKFYGRDIETLLSKTKISHSKRVFCKDKIEKKKLTMEDLDNGLKLYLKNNETQNVRDISLIKKQLQYSMYN
jgi:SpoVK/Ycf46/Vps4 family AAA+-type ATPase